MRTGTKEWSDVSINIQRGCENNCRYCYARYNAVNRFGRCTAEQWAEPIIDQKKVDKRYHKRAGVIMYPTTHDITLLNLSEYLYVLRKLLDAGNKVLIVTKPRWECVVMICEACREYKEQIVFRFTIGSTRSEVLRFWEPNAPDFTERLASLQYAYAGGYKTSVSCEPFLDGYVEDVYSFCRPFVNESFWIGKLNQFAARVDLDGVTKEQMANFVTPLLFAQKNSIVRAMVKVLDGKPFIKWKDSIQKVIGK